MIIYDAARAAVLARHGALETYPFDATTLVAKVGGKMFALVSPETPASISLKCDPYYATVLRDEYAAITAGYHLNKQHWNTVVLDDTIAAPFLEELIDESYRLVVASLTKAQRAQLDANRSDHS